jgi:hypothetical protein
VPGLVTVLVAVEGESRRLCSVKHLLWWALSEVRFDAVCERLNPVRVHLAVLV